MQATKTIEQRTAALRARLIDVYGPRNYRITASGEVHAYGQMPNSIKAGWWLVGQSVEDAEKEMRGN